MSPLGSQKEVVADIESVGYAVLRSHQVVESPCRTLWPLGLALIESAALFSVLDALPPAQGQPCTLLDGGESAGPNIDTRLRVIRDLCSASAYALSEMSSEQVPDVEDAPVVVVETPGGLHWVTLLREFLGPSDETCVTELCRLLN